MLRNLVFSKKLNSGWEWWAIKRTSFVVSIIVVFVAAYHSFVGIPYSAFAFVLSCTASYFGIRGGYRMASAILIGAGGIATYLGLLLFSVEPMLSLLFIVAGFLLALRLFSEGSAKV